MPEAIERGMAADAVNMAFSECVKRAASVFLDGLAAAGGDESEKAACLARLEAALKIHKEGHKASCDLVNRVFSE